MNRRDLLKLQFGRRAKNKGKNHSDGFREGKILRRDLLLISVGTVIGAVSRSLIPYPLNRSKTEEICSPKFVKPKTIEQLIESLRYQQSIYGTLENPTYALVTSTVNKFPTVGKDQFLGSYPSKAYEALQEKINKHEKRLEYYQRELQNTRNTSENERYETTINEVYGILEELKISLFTWHNSVKNNDNEMSLLRKVDHMKHKKIAEQEPKYGNIIIKANEIIKRITERQVPRSLEIRIEEIKDPLTGGQSWVFYNLIRYSDEGYEHSLNKHFHEFGHKAYLGDISFYLDFFQGRIDETDITRRREEVGVLEDAGAWLFSLAGVQETKKLHQELGDRMQMVLSANRIEKLREYEKGFNNSNAKGWALAEAMLEYFDRDYVKAYNHLSTRNQFSQLPNEVVANYKSFRKKVPRDEPGFFDEIELNTRFAEIRDQYINLIVKYSKEQTTAEQVWQKVMQKN